MFLKFFIFLSYWSSNQICVAKRASGGSCASNQECLTGSCISNVCQNDILSGAVFLKVPVSDVVNAGYSVILNEAYSFITTETLFQSTIRSQCNSASRLCVGGADSTGVTLQLVACGNCLVVTSETVINTPVLENGVYWYFTVGKSFGYTAVLPITQSSADTQRTIPEKRLSWHLSSGGFRIGAVLFATVERKMIFIKS